MPIIRFGDLWARNIVPSSEYVALRMDNEELIAGWVEDGGYLQINMTKPLSAPPHMIQLGIKDGHENFHPFIYMKDVGLGMIKEYPSWTVTPLDYLGSEFFKSVIPGHEGKYELQCS